MVTYKFETDEEYCVDCGGCFVICKGQNEVPPGTARVRVVTVDEGVPGEKNMALSCRHCSEPDCVAICPVTAITQRKDGIVLGDKTKCIGCRLCVTACPFAVPQYPQGLEGDLAEWNGKMDKCSVCIQPFVPLTELREPKARCALFCATKARTFV